MSIFGLTPDSLLDQLLEGEFSRGLSLANTGDQRFARLVCHRTLIDCQHRSHGLDDLFSRAETYVEKGDPDRADIHHLNVPVADMLAVAIADTYHVALDEPWVVGPSALRAIGRRIAQFDNLTHGIIFEDWCVTLTVHWSSSYD